MATATPVGTNARSPGESVTSAVSAARKSHPAAPSVAYAGRSRPSPCGKTSIGTVMTLIGIRDSDGILASSPESRVPRFLQSGHQIGRLDRQPRHVADDGERERPAIEKPPGLLPHVVRAHPLHPGDQLLGRNRASEVELVPRLLGGARNRR